MIDPFSRLDTLQQGMRATACSTLYFSFSKCLRALLLLLSGASHRFTQVGPYERLFAQSEGAAWAHSTSMARVALWQSLKALGVKAGDPVLLSPVNIPEMLAVIESLGLKPVYVDFAEHSLFVDPKDLETKILSSRARVFFLTYVAGQIGDLETVHSLCRRHEVAFVQDATQAPGCLYRGKSLTQWADLTFYSTCELKFIHTYRGGMLCGNSRDLEKRLLPLLGSVQKKSSLSSWLKKWFIDSCAGCALNPFWFGHFFHVFSSKIFVQDPLRDFRSFDPGKGAHRIFGSDYHLMKEQMPTFMVYRPSDFEARLGRLDLRRAPQRIESHKKISARYQKELQGLNLLPHVSPLAQSSYWRFPVLTKNAEQTERLRLQMKAQGVILEKTGLSFLPEDSSMRAASLIGNMLFLPCHAGVDETVTARIIAGLKSFAEARS